MKTNQPKVRVFVENCYRTFDECHKVLGDRGGQYDIHSDTWALDNFRAPSMIMVLRIINGRKVEDKSLEARCLQGSALLDQKINRIVGGYKPDTFVDLINYAADVNTDIQRLIAKYDSELIDLLKEDDKYPGDK
jgi:hypothetical protein